MVKSFLSIEDLSSEEQIAVEELKQRMVGQLDQEMYDDLSVFVRFLRARDLNVNAAEVMLKNHIEWRKKMQVDKISTNFNFKESLEPYVTFDIIGVDREGSPILYFETGNLDTRGLLKSARKIDLIKYIIQKLEKGVEMLKEQSVKLNRCVDKFTMIHNFENASLAVATHKESLEVIASLIMMYEANYPERLKSAYFINSSVYFKMAFAVVKNFISGKTFKKIQFFGKEGWAEELVKVIDPDVLPACLGGNRTDSSGNPLCPDIVSHGGAVPESFYINKKESSLASVPGVVKMTVTRMSKNQITFIIKEPGSHIEWEFETKSRDIGFSLLYKENEYDCSKIVLIPKQRIETNVSSETGLFKCDKLGIYIIEFDNTYSWIFQKEVYYRVSVVTELTP